MSAFGNTAGNYVDWDEPKTVVGNVVRFSAATDFDGNDCIVVEAENDAGDEFAITIAQAQLKAKFAEAFEHNGSLAELNEHHTGDRFAVEYQGKENRPNGRTLKKFVVERKAGETVAAAAPASLL